MAGTKRKSHNESDKGGAEQRICSESERGGVKQRIYTQSDIRNLHKELDEVLCPICMEHPHNAVLLLCSSHEKGCRTYICDTSSRHSNCLDQFKKLNGNTKKSPTLRSATRTFHRNNHTLNNAIRTFPIAFGDSIEPSRHLETQGETGNSESKLSLKCPMCRGGVQGWEVVEEARKYLNLKKRDCSKESCTFIGNYPELRLHARKVHPTSRPSETDPSREVAWRQIERQSANRDIILSAIQQDSVVENGDMFSVESERGIDEDDEAGWTVEYAFGFPSTGLTT